MFVIPGLALLIAFVYLRPQEYFTALQAVPLLYLLFGLCAVGVALDWRLRLTRPTGSPQLPFVVLYVLWCVLSLAIKLPSQLPSFLIEAVVFASLYFFVGHGLQSFRALEGIAGTLLAITLLLACFGAYQGQAPYGCLVIDQTIAHDTSVGIPDGRPCDTVLDCQRNDPEPGADYLCERIGLFGTHSIGKGRVRWRGLLQDPNELSLALGIGLPLAMGFYQRRSSWARRLLLGIALAAIGLCTAYTQSRGGQLVFATALGTYFVRRYGLRGALLGGVTALPLLLLGGRSGDEASASSIERLECWYEGISMFIHAPIAGVGTSLFTEHHYLTAHNSFVLAPAETGIVGMFLFTAVLYASLRIPLAVLAHLSDGPQAADPRTAVGRAWAQALLASFAAVLVGIFFLSFCYHPVLWIYVGLTAALYQAVRAHDPRFGVRMGLRELLHVLAIDGVLLAALFLYTRVKSP